MQKVIRTIFGKQNTNLTELQKLLDDGYEVKHATAIEASQYNVPVIEYILVKTENANKKTFYTDAELQMVLGVPVK